MRILMFDSAVVRERCGIRRMPEPPPADRLTKFAGRSTKLCPDVRVGPATVGRAGLPIPSTRSRALFLPAPRDERGFLPQDAE